MMLLGIAEVSRCLLPRVAAMASSAKADSRGGAVYSRLVVVKTLVKGPTTLI